MNAYFVVVIVLLVLPALFGCASLALTANPGSLLIAEDGQARVSIVVASDAPPATRHAAEELQHFLSKITGAAIPLMTDDAPPAAHEILVGDSRRIRDMNILVDYAALGSEGYVIRTRGPHLIITGGNPRGTLYGVYGFLEDHLGCRWFTPDVSFIPEARVLAVLPIDEVRIPVLEYREPFVYECFDGDWAARNRMNSTHARLEERHGGKVVYHGFVHTFEQLLPPAQYFDEHPEYFSLVGGKRLRDRSQLCCTNPDVVRLVTEEVLRRMRAHPEATVFSVSQNDWYNYCECEPCTALAEAEGSQMAPVLYLVNHVARAAAKEFPDKLVDTLAYQYTRRPPKTMRPEPNVIIRLCSIECDFAHPFELRSTPENRRFCDDLEAWAKVSNRLWVWNYNTSFSHYLVPFPNLRVRGPNIRYLIANNVRGIFEQDVYTTPHGELSALSGYLGAKLLWNPNYDTDTAINEFLQNVYGAAATPIRAYIDLIHEAVADPATTLHIWIGPDEPFLTKELLERADALWELAESATADDPEVLERVRIARLSVDYTILEHIRVRGAAYAFDHERFTVSLHPDYQRRADRFFEVAERHGFRAIRETNGELEVYKQQVYQRSWDGPMTPIAATAAIQPAPGIRYDYYELQLAKLPDFAPLSPVASGVADRISLDPALHKDGFALRFRGYVHAPADGVYSFTALSNDGSTIHIGDRLVVDNDGLHKAEAVTGFVALRAGYHPITVSYFESGGTETLQVFYAGPGIPNQEIPATALFHRP